MLHNPKIGFIARCDNGGLGIESLEFYQHFKPKTLVVLIGKYQQFPERFPNAKVVKGVPTDNDLEEFLKDIDILFCIETPYNWNTFTIARSKKIKTILRINYEWLPKTLVSRPDLFIAPSTWHFQDIPDPKVYLPFPVNREKLPFKLRKKAKTFLHIQGHSDSKGYNRNGTDVFLKAVPKVKSKVSFVLKSQLLNEEKENDRIQYKIGNFKNYQDIYQDEDVLILPRKYGGQSLQLNEALSKGMVAIMTDAEPQNQFLPKECLVKPIREERIKIFREIEYYEVSPEDLAEKIDEIANKDITKYSKISNQIAEKWSWKNLLPKYNQIFKNL